MFCFPIADGSGIEYKVVFMKLGSQSMHAKVLERIERGCVLTTISRLKTRTPGNHWTTSSRWATCLHTLPLYFRPTVRRYSLSLSMVRPATTIVKMNVFLFICLAYTQWYDSLNYFAFIRWSNFSGFTVSAWSSPHPPFGPYGLPRPGMNISVGFKLDVIVIAILCLRTHIQIKMIKKPPELHPIL